MAGRTDNSSGGHVLERVGGRIWVVVKGVAVGLLVLFASGVVFTVGTGAVGLGPGDSGWGQLFVLWVLANIVFMWAYGTHLKEQSPYWP